MFDYQWRVMFEGEDHTIWCEVENLTKTEAEDWAEKNANRWPEARCWIERMDS